MYRKLLICLFCLAAALPLAAKDYMRITVLNVGQGLSCVVETPDRKVMVFDCGSESLQFNRRKKNRTVDYLRSRGIKHVDVLVMSHGDADHCSGMGLLLDYFTPGVFCDNGAALQGEESKNLRIGLIKNGVSRKILKPGASFRLGKYVSCISVNPELPDGNRGSIALHITYGAASVLLTGDMDINDEMKMCRVFGKSLKADVLLLPHHGASTSTSDFLLDTVRPSLAVISAGRHNKYGHPDKRRLEERKINRLITFEKGDIVLVSDGRRMGFVQKKQNDRFRFLKLFRKKKYAEAGGI